MFNATVIVKYSTTKPLPSYIDPDINLSTNNVTKSTLVGSQNGILIVDGISEVSTIATLPCVAGNLDGKYFTIDTPNNGYYVWMNVFGSDPGPIAGPFGPRIGISISLANNVSDINVAIAIRSAMLATGEFIIPPPVLNLLTITNVTEGTLVNAITDGSGFLLTGFTFAVLTVGTGSIALGDRILVKDEIAGLIQYNGIYLVSQTGSNALPWQLQRDFSVIYLKQGDTVFITSGTNNSGSLAILNNNITMPGQSGSPANFTIIMGSGGVDFNSIAPLGSPDVCGSLIVRTDSTAQVGIGDSWTVLLPGAAGQYLRVATNPTMPPQTEQCLEWGSIDTNSLLKPPLQVDGDMIILKSTVPSRLAAGSQGQFLVVDQTITNIPTNGVTWKSITIKDISPPAANCGDMLVYDGSAWQVLANPSAPAFNNYVLTIDTMAPLCVNWKQFSASAVGLIGQVQYTNGAGSFLATPGFEFNNSPNVLTIPAIGKYSIKSAATRTLLYAPSTTDPSLSTNVAVGGDVSASIMGTDNIIMGSGSFGSANAISQTIIIGNNAATGAVSGSELIVIGHSSLALADTPQNMIAIGSHTLDNFIGYVGDAGNIAIGFESQTSHASALKNTSLGSGALRNMLGSPASPGNNTAVGFEAARNTLNGQYISALGYQSLYNNQNGNRSCAVGWQALFGSALGSYDDMCAFGHRSLSSVDGSGLFNNAFGSQSLRSLVGGNFNNAFGYNTLRDNINGNRNNAFGYQSLRLMTSDDNSAFGHATMQSATGLQNCAFGSQSLTALTNGGDNSMYGFQSGFKITTGQFNSGFGSQALQESVIGTFNSAFGYQSLNQNVGTSSNSAFGALAMQNNTGSNSSAFGYNCLNRNSSNSCAFGANALSSGALGSNNLCAFGFNALQSNTNGTNNNAFGYQSLDSNTTGDNNCSFGNTTLNSNTVGDNNSAFGSTALRFNITGLNNCAFGFNAGAYITTSNNSAFGTSALGGLGPSVTGIENNAFGYQSLYRITSGNSNVAIGNNTGDAITTGNNNTLLGNNAGTSLVSGDDNVIVGQSDVTTTRNGCILLGNGAIVTKNNTIGLPSRATNNGAGLTPGGASALPATPRTYLEINIGGTLYSIPLYT